MDHRPIDQQEQRFQNRCGRLFREYETRWESNRVSRERLARDQEGAARYLQNSILSTRSHELSTAQKWGRQGAMHVRETMGQVKRGSSINYPVPKRSRSVQVERMREMNNQFAECLNLYQAMDQEMQTFQHFQPVGNDAGVLKRNCKHCSRLSGIPIYHVGPYGGRGPNCIFDQTGRQRRPICGPAQINQVNSGQIV